jgi:hypothetical protein
VALAGITEAMHRGVDAGSEVGGGQGPRIARGGRELEGPGGHRPDGLGLHRGPHRVGLPGHDQRRLGRRITRRDGPEVGLLEDLDGPRELAALVVDETHPPRQRGRDRERSPAARRKAAIAASQYRGEGSRRRPARGRRSRLLRMRAAAARWRRTHRLDDVGATLTEQPPGSRRVADRDQLGQGVLESALAEVPVGGRRWSADTSS